MHPFAITAIAIVGVLALVLLMVLVAWLLIKCAYLAGKKSGIEDAAEVCSDAANHLTDRGRHAPLFQTIQIASGATALQVTSDKLKQLAGQVYGSAR